MIISIFSFSGLVNIQLLPVIAWIFIEPPSVQVRGIKKEDSKVIRWQKEQEKEPASIIVSPACPEAMKGLNIITKQWFLYANSQLEFSHSVICLLCKIPAVETTSRVPLSFDSAKVSCPILRYSFSPFLAHKLESPPAETESTRHHCN